MLFYDTLSRLLDSRKNEKIRGITFILDDLDERFISYEELYHNALFILHNLQIRLHRLKYSFFYG